MCNHNALIFTCHIHSQRGLSIEKLSDEVEGPDDGAGRSSQELSQQGVPLSISMVNGTRKGSPSGSEDGKAHELPTACDCSASLTPEDLD